MEENEELELHEHDCSCCAHASECGTVQEDVDMEEPVISLIDENGKEVVFEILDSIEYNDCDYLITISHEDDEDSENAEVVILKVEEQDGEELYATVDDEDEAKKVYEIFKEQNKDEFDFADED